MAAAFLLGSCGGGGAETGNTGGNLLLLPLSGTFYAGMPSQMTITGGRHPYRIISGEPGILPVPAELNQSTFTVIPNNPGVVDNSTAELPVRSIIVSATDSTNGFAQATITVAQNFLTGYGVTYISNCPTASGGTPPPACAGGETAIRLEATINGSLIGFRTYRLDILRGPFAWEFPGTNVTGDSITVTTDHEGKTNAIFRVNNNVATQLGVYRITDIATGVSTEQVFTIDGTGLTNELTIIPNEFTFTGPNSAACGTGQADFLVFDGIPPYTAVSSFANVTVTPSSTNTQPGRFTLQVNDPTTCLTNATIIVTDSNNARGTVTITTSPGEGDPPPTPLRAVPSSMTLTCGQSGGTLIVGGGGGTIGFVNNDPNLSVVVAGNSATITRALDAANPAGQVNSVVTFTDGSSTTSVTVRNPATCT